jgi:hypothetical protein
MPNRPVPNSHFTTSGQVRVAKDGTGVDNPHFSLECRITKESGDAAIKHAFPVDLPAYALVDTIEIHPEGASTIATGTSVGIGGTSDPDEYMEIAENSVDAVGENVISVAARVNPANSAKTLYLHSTNGSGTGAGTIYGDWSIRVTGKIINPIDS